MARHKRTSCGNPSLPQAHLTPPPPPPQAWRLSTGELLQTFRGHEDFVMDIALSTHEKDLLVSCSRNAAKSWKVILLPCRFERLVLIILADSKMDMHSCPRYPKVPRFKYLVDGLA